jgi:hypothetical protein
LDAITLLTQELDPLRPLEAEETDLYVDWQAALGLDDVKPVLERAIRRNGPSTPASWLFTGFRGGGKTTELNRVKRSLESAGRSDRTFVSMLLAEEWIALSDLQPQELILEIVRQLVADLELIGFRAAGDRFRAFFADLLDFLRRVQPEGFDIGLDPLTFKFTLTDFPPSARRQFREFLDPRLPSLYDLVNREIIERARTWLSEPGHGGYSDIVLLVDELDRIPLEQIGSSTNQEMLFIHNAAKLRALNCQVVYTIPLELAYGRLGTQISDIYGSSVHTLTTVPVIDRDGNDHERGIAILEAIVSARARKVGIALSDVFVDPQDLRRILRLSGGYIRELFVLLREVLNRADSLPVSSAAVDRALTSEKTAMMRRITPGERILLEEIHGSRSRVNADETAWNLLLRDRLVLIYEDDRGFWYDWNPLLDPGM